MSSAHTHTHSHTIISSVAIYLFVAPRHRVHCLYLVARMYIQTYTNTHNHMLMYLQCYYLVVPVVVLDALGACLPPPSATFRAAMLCVLCALAMRRFCLTKILH